VEEEETEEREARNGKKKESRMPTPQDPRKREGSRIEKPSTYFVQDSRNKEELIRLALQDQMITTAMGGVLSEQPDPTVFQRVLDIGCGTGGWMIEAARTYPTMSLTGIDISARMIDYARTQAEAHQFADRLEFHVMDALRRLEFPDAFFDLVNLRFGFSFVRIWEWPELLKMMLELTRPGGVVRLTETAILHQSTSPALTQLQEMAVCAFSRAGHTFELEPRGVIPHLARLLRQYVVPHVQTKAYALEFRAGTKEGEAYAEDMGHVHQTIRPFLEKRGCFSQEHRAIYQRALNEMHQSDFCSTWELLTAWGIRPG
jgi:ubiquinone/menaquinone biosynthesis C-methylase UbiE